MGSRGQPAAQDTRCRETFPAVSHGKGGSPPWAPSWPSDLWTSCSQAARGTQLQSEGPPGQPWEAGPPDRPSGHTGPSLRLLPSPIRTTAGDRSPQELLAAARQPLQMCTAGPGPLQVLVDRRQAEFYLPWEAGAEPGEQLGQPEGPGRGQQGNRACPPTASPRQALPPKMSLFRARRQNFLLLEKRAFTGA